MITFEWIIVVADLIQELGDIEYEEGIESRIYEEMKLRNGRE